MKNYNEFLKAKELANEEKYKDAIVILKRLCKFEPNNLILKFELARLLIKYKEKKDEGKVLLEELLDTTNKVYAMFELAKLEIEEENYEKAKEMLEKIIDTENNCLAILELTKLEIKGENLEEANYYFEKLLEIIFEPNVDYKMYLDDAKMTLIKLIFLEIKNKKYKEAYDHFLIFDDYPKLNNIEAIKINFYLKYKLNQLTDEEKKNDSYFCNQLLNYNEEKAIEHIKLHLDENNFKKNHTCYNKELNINILYNDTKYRIYNMSPIKSTLVDRYIIECEYVVGSINNIETNVVEVVTFSNTKNILTIYPIIRETEKDITKENITCEQKDNEKDKVKQIKRVSQIDKFNRKYGLK